jgi:tetratricopeptide (TPR) repeat protein
MLIAAALLVAAATSCEVSSAEVVAQTRMRYEAFDSHAGPYGWRSLLDSGCTDAAVALLAAYSKAKPNLTQEQRLELQFHMGQALAMSGRHDKAVPYFERALEPGSPAEWRTYVEATLAFLHHDAQMLAAARTAYATIAPNSMRLKIIDGMLACPNERYAKAVHCSM